MTVTPSGDEKEPRSADASATEPAELGRILLQFSSWNEQQRQEAYEDFLKLPDPMRQRFLEGLRQADTVDTAALVCLLSVAGRAPELLLSTFGWHYLRSRLWMRRLMLGAGRKKRPWLARTITGYEASTLRHLDTFFCSDPESGPPSARAVRRLQIRVPETQTLLHPREAEIRREAFDLTLGLCRRGNLWDVLRETKATDLWAHLAALAVSRKAVRENRPLLVAFPHVFCSRCRTRGRRAALKLGGMASRPYVTCRTCSADAWLLHPVRKVVGVIGIERLEPELKSGICRVAVWDQERRAVCGAEVDALEIRTGNGVDCAYAINAVWAHVAGDISRSRRRLHRLPVSVVGPELPEKVQRVLETQFGEITRTSKVKDGV